MLVLFPQVWVICTHKWLVSGSWVVMVVHKVMQVVGQVVLLVEVQVVGQVVVQVVGDKDQLVVVEDRVVLLVVGDKDHLVVVEVQGILP